MIDHFGELTCARLTHQGVSARERHGSWFGRFKNGSITTTHDGEQTILSAALTSRNGRVNEIQAKRFGRSVKLARHIGGGRGVVHQSSAFFHASQSAVCTEYDSAQIFIVADAAKNDVGIFHGFSGRRGMRRLAAVGKLLAPCRCFGRAAVVNGHCVASAGQVTRHGIAHDA